MDRMNSGDRAFARIASPFISGVKRVLTGIGIFTDSKAYKDEIARYESELRQFSGHENERQVNIDAEEREVPVRARRMDSLERGVDLSPAARHAQALPDHRPELGQERRRGYWQETRWSRDECPEGTSNSPGGRCGYGEA